MSTERDELTEKIKGEISHHISPVIGWLRLDATKGAVDTSGKRHEAWLVRLDKATEAIAELVKPRTVTTVEELDALPDGSVILAGRDSLQKDGVGYWYFWGGDVGLEPNELDLPCTVLHEGASE